MGIALSGSTITAILNSCSPSKPALGWEPQVLTEDQSRTIGAIADTILPKTDSPGALDLLVDRFVDVMIQTTYKDDDKATFISDLNAFMASCEKEYGSSYDELSADQKVEIIAELEKSSDKNVEKVWGKKIEADRPTPFYRKLKGLVLLGYYTSEEVGKNIFSYDPMPGAQIGCIPLADVGNSWTEG